MNPPPIPKKQIDIMWFINKLLLVIGIAILIWFVSLPFQCASAVLDAKDGIESN
jgi:hypothetical protein